MCKDKLSALVWSKWNVIATWNLHTFTNELLAFEYRLFQPIWILQSGDIILLFFQDSQDTNCATFRWMWYRALLRPLLRRRDVDTLYWFEFNWIGEVLCVRIMNEVCSWLYICIKFFRIEISMCNSNFDIGTIKCRFYFNFLSKQKLFWNVIENIHVVLCKTCNNSMRDRWNGRKFATVQCYTLYRPT